MENQTTKQKLEKLYNEFRVYLDNPANAPKGAIVKMGPRGKYYYDTKKGEVGRPQANDKKTKQSMEAINMTKLQERIQKLKEVLIMNAKEQEKLVDKAVEFIKKSIKGGKSAKVNDISYFIQTEMPGLTMDETLMIASMAITRWQSFQTQYLHERVGKLYETFRFREQEEKIIEDEVLDTVTKYAGIDKNHLISEAKRTLYNYDEKEIEFKVNELIEDGKLVWQGTNLTRG